MLSGDAEQASQQLDEGLASVLEEFAYSGVGPNMSEQLVTGSAIHLAASRGHRWLVEMLLDRGASIESMVQRDGLPYDNVIHVAVWKEGRGGDKDMISFLCARGSDIASTRADGGSCLHVAFMTGNEATIRAVQDQMEEDGCNTHEFLYDDSSSAERTETPLELGIKAGKLSQEALAALAPPHLSSLRVFIHHAPECIPSFMVRLMRAESDRGVTVSGGVADVLFDKLSSLDIARLILDFPEAFASLLNVCTTRPAVVCPGWHPLPQRMSFAGQHVFTRMYVWLFGVPSFVTFYVQDTQWEFNDATYSAPAWHQQITAQKSAPYKDVKIQVCRLPNIISPKVFAPLVRSADQGQFLHLVPAIRAAVSHTFWNGAVWMEVSQFILALWGLILLVIETLHKHEAAMAAMGSDREMTEEAFDPSYAADSLTHGVVADWIIAKGIVDLLLELVQIWGCDLVGELRSYAARFAFETSLAFFVMSEQESLADRGHPWQHLGLEPQHHSHLAIGPPWAPLLAPAGRADLLGAPARGVDPLGGDPVAAPKNFSNPNKVLCPLAA